MVDANATPPLPTSNFGPVLGADELVRAGDTYHVFLAGYSLTGLWAAWGEMHRHAREYSDMSLPGALYTGAAPETRAPAVIGRNSVGPVAQAQQAIRTWRETGNEYTWGRLFSRMQAAYHDAAPTGGTLGAWCARRELASGEATRIAARDALESAASGIGGALTGAADAVAGAGNLVEGAGAAAKSLGEGLNTLGQVSRLSPLATVAALAGIALAVFVIVRRAP